MSHIPQRKEKDCLNCGTIVQGRYCHVCGQENVVPKESFWHMVTHFFYDITHFDSKFFETVKDLVFRPGFLPKEYMKGRRASYLHPVKMYVFTSAIFFLLFFSFFSDDTFTMNSPERMTSAERFEEIAEIETKLLKDTSGTTNDSIRRRRLQKLQSMKDTTKTLTWADFAEVQDNLLQINLSGKSSQFKTPQQYDSVQKLLPASEKDGWFTRRLVEKEISMNRKYSTNPEAAFEKLGQTVLHRLPYMLFVSLPLFAFILKLLYIRRRQFYYADHGVFTIHLYIFSFILLLVIFGLNKVGELTGWGFMGYIMALLFLVLNFYLYKAMRVFYGQARFKTFIKFLLTAFFSLIMMLILLAIFLFFSAIEL